jgi:hypothetical protein
MHKSSGYILIFWIVILGWMRPGFAEPLQSQSTQMPLPPGIEIHVKATPTTGTIGDPIRIDFDIAMPEGYRIEIPKPQTVIGDFAILDFSPGPVIAGTGISPTPKPSETARTGAPPHHQAQMIAAIYKTGKFTFPSIPIKIKTAEGREIAASSPPVSIEIQSVLGDKNSGLKDLKKQAEIPEPIRWALWLSIALAIVILGAIAWFFWKRRLKRPAPLSPEQTQNLLDLAEADLKNLFARGFPDNGTEKRFYILLSEIIKRILEAGYEISTAEQTTSEIMDSLHSRVISEPEDAARMESFLLRCDVVKFAKYIPSIMEHESAAKDALQILAQAKKAAGSRQPAGNQIQPAKQVV